MRIKKSWKITGISIVASAAVIAPVVVLLYPVDLNQAMQNYVLHFKDGSGVSEADKKNAYISEMMSKTSNIINDYKTQPGKQNSSLDFWSLNLQSKQSAGELNYFDTLNRSMRYINPSLGIKNIQRTPQSTQEGYYNRNTELMSFYWSPDYNGVGTWTGYMFSDSFNLPNMWPPTFRILEKERDNPGSTGHSWAPSLWSEFATKAIPGISHADNLLFRNPTDILRWMASEANFGGGGTILGIEDYLTFIGNVIGAWITEKTSTDIIKGADGKNEYSSVGLGVDYVNWIASQNPNIPYAEEGPDTSTPFLVRKGLYKQENPNIDSNYRDWYIRPDEIGAKKDITIWTAQHPFENTKTAWNPTFSQAPNTMYAGTAWAGLSSWTTIGDENDSQLKYENTNFLAANGIMEDIVDPTVFGNLETQFASGSVEFKIRPIPWITTRGTPAKNGTQEMYLSPQDFLAGFQGFMRSITSGLNSNNAYFIGLSGIDFDATFAHAANNARNTSASDQKPFKIFFKDAILSFKDTLDILQKQYFFALPAWHQKVLNITDDAAWRLAANLDPNGKLLTAVQDFSKFYGCGDGTDKNVWEDTVYAAPYYMSQVDKEGVTYELSESYFRVFDDVKDKLGYTNYNRSIDGTERIKTIRRKYAGSYNPSILFEQFKAKEVDYSPILSSSFNDALNNFKTELKYYGVQKISKSNSYGYNLQIYEKFTESAQPAGKGKAQNIILDTDGLPMWNPITREPLYTIDEYGNYVFPEGRTPKLKSRVSQSYYDLIAKDFYTPISAGGKSWTIRHTINNSINWVALKSLTSPGVSVSIQYSFMPYGVYSWIDTNTVITGEYWDLIANKRYDTFDPGDTFTPESRQTGNMIWTYDEMRKGMIK